MTKKIILSLLFFVSLIAQTFGQRRTTTVKSYYRKDGTYVSSHTRHYNAGSGSYSSSNYSSSSDNNHSNEYPVSSLTFTAMDNTDIPKTTSKYSYDKKEKVIATTLSAVIEKDLEVGNATSVDLDTTKQKEATGVVIYVSVLRYNGTTLDICPISRGILGDWEYSKIYHKFKKTLISTEDALDLVSNYDWTIREQEISKNFTYSFNDKGLPKYLTKTVEAIKMK